MLKLYSLEEARLSILKRNQDFEINYPESITSRTEAIFGKGVSPEQAVAIILQEVREGKDKALREFSLKIDNARIDELLISPNELERAYRSLPSELITSMELAAVRIRVFHEAQPVESWQIEDEGGYLGQRIIPLSQVGIYVPGGTAALPSSLLMAAIPAQVAGVKDILICSPPQVDPTILAAAHICGIERVYQVGGAQAIAAMAFGTESVPKVDKIVGAGNLFVNLAKRMVFGFVGIDGLAGPTETMIIADESANPAWVAADLLAQAEHDILASAILLTPSKEFALKVQQEASDQIKDLPRAKVIKESLQNNGGVIVTQSLSAAVEVANNYAPEHLCLSCKNEDKLPDQIRNAGGIFLGERSFEVLGDYLAGPSHIMPTGGSARFASPLSVLDFVKITSIIALDDHVSQSLSVTALNLAAAEKLDAHARAAEFRAKLRKSDNK